MLWAVVLFACISMIVGAEDKPAAPRVVPLRQAHAHNDYEHKRPLLDALENGFCSVEADIYLVDKQLLVGHNRADLRPERTLEKLYLDPFRKLAQANGGRVYPDGPAVYLLVDVKSEARQTYAALDKVLARYAGILSVTRKGKFEARAVTVVVSGNRAQEAIAAQEVRYTGIDGRPGDLDSDKPAHLMPWISTSWGSQFNWRGKGPMPDKERARLRDFVRRAHQRGRLVRFWATPESTAVWKELLAAKVDLINTDKLPELRQFLLAQPGANLKDKPTPLKGAIIVVDPGHGGQRYSKSYTGGTRGVVSRLTESELNLRVAVELAKLLKEQGETVFMTREADHRLSREGSSNKDELHARIDFFERHNAHFFLSVHHNAGRANATGHTALYKHNAPDDTLYKALARDVNDALEGAVPGPKLRLIKGSYHILRETAIPGTISESGFMTNKAFDELATQADYPRKEAAAICKGAIKYWADHNKALIALRDKLMKERVEHPRSPKAYTAIGLNPDFRARMKQLLAEVAPDGKYDPAKVGKYVEEFKKTVVKDPKAKFTVKGEFDGKLIKLSGETSAREYHDQLIDMLVAMKLFNIANGIRFPKTR
jgi:N-acetylmuramoyl-L-alanine amidase